MSDSPAILELLSASPLPEVDLPSIAIDLRVDPGDLTLIEVRNPVWVSDFADLCCGLTPPAVGAVRFLGRDWVDLSETQAAALRGRIGYVHATHPWIEFMGTDQNILLPQLHHTRRPLDGLRDDAAELARQFGLPGLPLVSPKVLTPADLARAACVRAFLGEPRLLLLESPAEGEFDLVVPLLNALARARDRGAAAIWLTRSELIWNDTSFPATHRSRLTDRGLITLRYGP